MDKPSGDGSSGIERDELLAVCGVGAGYGGRQVVTGIDLTVNAGDIVGLLGANGSGKSTLLKAITGQIRLMSGRVAINGIDLAARPEAAKVGFGLAVDGPELPAPLSGRQYLDLVASIRRCRIADDEWAGRIARLRLAPWLDRPIAEYSLGTRAKLSIAAALLGSPPLLIFDETLNGLDPVAVWEAKCLIAELVGGGSHAAIVSTHAVEAVPAFCTRAVLLSEGRVVTAWDTAELSRAAAAPGGFEDSMMQALTKGQGAAAIDGATAAGRAYSQSA
ncbi:ABC transporter ATP-binding protein [Aquabacter sp. CN5-332]|uniref:ABC transporter ATP-binding protein n=1 Tax=Aquabacter sp. CN5-332 TaxID=3156608 RepID=UPI0032B5EFED